MDLIITLFTFAILVLSVILHEVAHGWVADRLGDPTARLMGRLTLDPRPHIDLFTTILLPFLLFLSGLPVLGAAKPVPVDPFNLKEGRKDLALVSLAGPMTNILIAIIGSLLIKLIFALSPETFFLLITASILKVVVSLNLLLGIFNLIPIPPLDGSKIFALLLPEKEANAYLSIGSIGMFIIFFLLFFPIGGFSLGELLSRILQFTQNILLP